MHDSLGPHVQRVDHSRIGRHSPVFLKKAEIFPVSYSRKELNKGRSFANFLNKERKSPAAGQQPRLR
jgi:hypothetical protein